MSEVKVVNSVYDAVSDVTISIAEGAIERINIKRINADGSPKITSYTDKKTGRVKNINNTHRVGILLKMGDDSTWISFGTVEVKNLKYENNYQIKEGDEYVDLKEGMVIRVPVVHKSYSRGDEVVEFWEGKKSKIKIKDKSGARDPSRAKSNGPQGASAAVNSPASKTTKVYGEILSLEGSEALVRTENSGDVTVKLNVDQLAEVKEGGRLAGQRAEDGTLTQFKSYGPKGSAGSPGGSKGSYKKDTSGLETGHALNGALNLRRSGLIVPPVVEVAKVVHDVTKQLKQEESKNPENKGMSDYDLGAMVGHAVLNATRDIQVGENDNPEEVTEKLLAYARELMGEVVPGVASYIKGETQADNAKSTPDPELKPKNEPHEPPLKVSEKGHIDMTPQEIDFDDDIPF